LREEERFTNGPACASPVALGAGANVFDAIGRWFLKIIARTF